MTEHVPPPTPTPLLVKSVPDTSPTLSPADPRNQTAVATAVTSILVWLLTTKLHADPEVTAAVAVVVPAAVAWAGSHLAFRKTPPRLETPIHEVEAHP